jgi:formamidopyrimidine-DNA glycosylase
MAEIPWDLRRRALKDSIRHDTRVKEAIRQRCQELVTQLLDHTAMVGYGEIRYRDETTFYGWVKSSKKG